MPGFVALIAASPMHQEAVTIRNELRVAQLFGEAGPRGNAPGCAVVAADHILCVRFVADVIEIHDQSTIWQVLHCAVTLTLRVERQHAFVLERAAIIRAAPQLVDMLRFGTIPLIGCVIAKLQRQNLTITVQRVVDPPALRPNRHGSLPAFSVINAAGGLWGQVRLPQRILADIAQKVVSA